MVGHELPGLSSLQTQHELYSPMESNFTGAKENTWRLQFLVDERNKKKEIVKVTDLHFVGQSSHSPRY